MRGGTLVVDGVASGLEGVVHHVFVTMDPKAEAEGSVGRCPLGAVSFVAGSMIGEVLATSASKEAVQDGAATFDRPVPSAKAHLSAGL